MPYANAKDSNPAVLAAVQAAGYPKAGDAGIVKMSHPFDVFRPQVAAKLPATAYAARFGPAELLIRVDGSALDVTREDGPVDLAFAAGPGIYRLISGQLAPDRAIATGVVEVLRGRGALLDRFADTFHMAA